MDFLKNCRTNVQQVDDLGETPCATYMATTGQGDTTNSRQATAELREHGLLCSVSGIEIWIFGDNDDTAAGIVGRYGFKLASEGTFDVEIQLYTGSGEPVEAVFLSAVEEAIAFRLVGNAGILRVAPSTWLFAGIAEDDFVNEEAVLLRLFLGISEAGKLHARTNTQPTSLSAISEQANDIDEVLLAPGGQHAELAGAFEDDARSIYGDQWKALVTTTLRTEGIDIAPEEAWVSVKLRDLMSEDYFLWPRKLCLGPSGELRESLERCDWRHYFATHEEDNGFKHPLTIAEDWFTGAVHRGESAADDGNDATHEPFSSAAEFDNMLATSPPFVQRIADQQAAMAGIYPTPPDGMLPGQGLSTSQQPTSDNVTAAAITSDNAAQDQHEILPVSDEQHSRLNSSSSDHPGLARSGDDLFGDIGGEMDFGSVEVGDADFDFFNEDGNAESPTEDTRMLEVSNEVEENEGAADDVHVQSADVLPETPHMSDTDVDHAMETLADEQQQGGSATEAQHDLVLHHEFEPISAEQMIKLPQMQKPLSPFGIKERLLPPPIPASALHEHQRLDMRRSSTFEPMHFRDDLDIGRRFSSQYGPPVGMPSEKSSSNPGASVNISLPPRRKKPRLGRPRDRDLEPSGIESDSEDDSYESASSVSDEGLPPKVPWISKKRKRADFEDHVLSGELGRMLGHEEVDLSGAEEASEQQMQAVLEQVMLNSGRGDEPLATSGDRSRTTQPEQQTLPSVEGTLRLTKLDMVYTAQLISEQAASCMPSIAKALDLLALNDDRGATAGSALQNFTDLVIEQLLPDTTRCDLAKLALIREPPPRSIPQAVSRPGQPKPPQRSDSVSLGPDIAPIPAPFVRVRRGNDAYEMLPPALDFWETLSLAPINGQKDVRAFCVFPLNEELQRLCDTFLSELGGVYESCKLGSHAHIRNVDESNDLDDYEDGLAPVELGDDIGVEDALKGYGDVCTQLGAFLAGNASQEPDRTIVVYLLNPFPHARITQHLCACFWRLCKAYRERIAKAARGQPRSDIVLQLLPIELVASPDGLVVLDAKQYASIAKEVYDRCPPPLDSDSGVSSALPYYAAPFVELTSQWPKRIGFQLTAEPPRDLLHEGSTLHVAYVVSADGQWVTAAWVDSTGRYQSNSSLCLCGRSFADVAAEIWERTREIVASRDVTWRIFVVTVGDMDQSIKACWRAVIERPRKQAFSVTLLAATLEPELEVTPSALANEESAAGANQSGAGFLTPGSTPQGTTMTVSPDTSGHYAPPTPAPSDSAAVVNDPDTDAHLIDIADESWSVLFSPSTYSTLKAPDDALAYGALFKRGDVGGTEPSRPGPRLPCLALSLFWTVQVRPNGNVDEGNVKQSEMTLREVLKMYRNLSVLTKARGLAGARKASNGCVPVHLVAAVSGAKALGGLL